MRAPDENVFIPPFNLVELFLLALPLESWMNKRAYERLNYVVMAIIYSPLLLITAYFETRQAVEIRANRSHGEDDDVVVEEWEQIADQLDFQSDGWDETIMAVKPNLDDDPTALEVQQLREEIAGLREMITELGRMVRTKQGLFQNQTEVDEAAQDRNVNNLLD